MLVIRTLKVVQHGQTSTCHDQRQLQEQLIPIHQEPTLLNMTTLIHQETQQLKREQLLWWMHEHQQSLSLEQILHWKHQPTATLTLVPHGQTPSMAHDQLSTELDETHDHSNHQEQSTSLKQESTASPI